MEAAKYPQTAVKRVSSGSEWEAKVGRASSSRMDAPHQVLSHRPAPRGGTDLHPPAASWGDVPSHATAFEQACEGMSG